MKFIGYYLSLLILIPSVVGWARFHKISSAFLPFLLLTWIGAVNEVTTFTLVFGFHQYNIVNTNLYQLIEALLILWQFKRWHLFINEKGFQAIFASFVGAFLLENILVSKIYLGFNSYFHIYYSFIIVLLSINMINQVLMKERGSLLYNSTFIISSVFVVLFTYTLLVETFWAYGLKMSADFRISLNHIFYVINFLCNVIFTLAIVWMPKRQAFILQY